MSGVVVVVRSCCYMSCFFASLLFVFKFFSFFPFLSSFCVDAAVRSTIRILRLASFACSVWLLWDVCVFFCFGFLFLSSSF